MTDDEIRERLADIEDAWTERKTAAHSEEIRKTLVAFANSVPEAEEAILFVGVADDGSIIGVVDAEKTQTSITKAARECHPEVKTRMRVVTIDDKSVIAVVVRASTERPHFAGPAYVRKGHESVKANDSQFDELIASRISVARPLLEAKHKGERVIVFDYQMGRNMGCMTHSCAVMECTAVYAVFHSQSNGMEISADLREIRVSKHRDGLRVEIDRPWGR